MHQPRAAPRLWRQLPTRCGAVEGPSLPRGPRQEGRAGQGAAGALHLQPLPSASTTASDVRR